MSNQTVVILDFGGQYKELIARRVRECGVYSVILPGFKSVEEIKAMNPIGIILTGGPDSVYRPESPKCDKKIFELGVPVLGICYGLQLLSYTLGGTVAPGSIKEYGKIDVEVNSNSKLFKGMDKDQVMLMSHTDKVTVLPEGFVSVASTANTENAAIENVEKRLYGLQFHPEVERSINGTEVIRNFLYNVCEAKGDYTMDDFIETQCKKIQEVTNGKKVLLGLSGGVDSAVCAALLSKAIPGKVVCVFVDHGMMRKNEGDEIEEIFSKKDVDFIRVNAEDIFLGALKGVTEPETKRKTIGKLFVDVFEDTAKKLGNPEDFYFAQGTIYPDVIESGKGTGAAVIKSHHNVGGLPERIKFLGIVEPLRSLFKDEVRKVGTKLGLPSSLVNRQPFPGPGLAIRVIGDLTKEKLDTLREADYIFRYELEKANVCAQQYFAVLTNIRSVGVMGDGRTYDYTCALRAVNTTDFMTCEFAEVPYSVLGIVSSRIVNEVKGINRVVYDVTGKPPSTIEWE